MFFMESDLRLIISRAACAAAMAVAGAQRGGRWRLRRRGAVRCRNPACCLRGLMHPNRPPPSPSHVLNAPVRVAAPRKNGWSRIILSENPKLVVVNVLSSSGRSVLKGERRRATINCCPTVMQTNRTFPTHPVHPLYVLVVPPPAPAPAVPSS